MLEDLIIDLIKDLIASTHTEGILFFAVGSGVLLSVQIHRDEEIRTGLKGENKLFEAPEISLYFFFWYSPYVLMYGAFMQVEISVNILLFMAANLAFALLGRYGLQQLLVGRFGGTTTKETMKETTKTTTKDETGA